MRCYFKARLTLLYMHILNKKIMLMMNLLNMYVLFSYHISHQHWINPFQECRKYILKMNYVDGLVGMRSCHLFRPSYYLN